MDKLVFATNNLNKLNEVRQIFEGQFEILGLKDIGCFEDIPETGDTLEENASIKSEHVWQKYGLNCFSDDTGLEIDFLDGAPGVISARYAGEPVNAENNMSKVLSDMGDTTNRSANFRTVISLIIDGKEVQFEGKVTGVITTERLYGESGQGFGYDPIFIPDVDWARGRSFAQVTSQEKNSCSHRGRAVEKLTKFLLK